MKLQQLRYLLAVVEHGGMTAAAQALYVDQSALSKSLQALERELHTELFVRGVRGSVPTAEGARVAHLAECVVSQVRAIESVFRPENGSVVTGRLSLGSTQSLAIELITTFLPAFRTRQPGISVDVRPFDSPDDAVDALRRAELDLVLTELPMPSDLRVQPFHQHEVVLVSPLGLKLPDPVPWPTLNGMPMIMPTTGGSRRKQFDRFFARREIFPQVVMETDERGAWMSCVAEGHGSLLWYREIAQRFASTVAIRSMSPPLHQTVALGWTRRPLSPEARALCTYAHAYAVRHSRHGRPSA